MRIGTIDSPVGRSSQDRKDRILSSEDIRHYCRVATALVETIKIQKKIDGVIEKHGGWPIS